MDAEQEYHDGCPPNGVCRDNPRWYHTTMSDDIPRPQYDAVWIGRRPWAQARQPQPPAALDGPGEGTRLMLVSDGALERLAADAGCTVAWGEPDEHGWYVPTLTRVKR